MIKTKNDLAGKYALRSDTEVFSLFMDKCEEFGVVWLDSRSEPRQVDMGQAVYLTKVVTREGLVFSDVYNTSQDMIKLTLADFQDTSVQVPLPVKTKTKYVTAHYNSAWEAVKAFEEGVELYSDSLGAFNQVHDIQHIVKYYKSFCHKVVSELTWKDSLQEYLEQPSADPSGFVSMSLFGEEWSLSEGEFLELCKVVVSSLGESASVACLSEINSQSDL